MDYTDLARVKRALGNTETGDDTLLGELITRASRAIDRKCCNARADDYFAMAAVAGETLRNAQVDARGNLLCWPHKPVVTSIAALSYRSSPLSSWSDVNLDVVEVEGCRVTAWLKLPRQKLTVLVSYTGGLGATVDDLPADLVEAATVLTVRFYREVKSGLTDTIGVAELGTLQYTKAWPSRVLDMLRPYMRVEPW